MITPTLQRAIECAAKATIDIGEEWPAPDLVDTLAALFVVDGDKLAKEIGARIAEANREQERAEKADEHADGECGGVRECYLCDEADAEDQRDRAADAAEYAIHRGEW